MLTIENMQEKKRKLLPVRFDDAKKKNDGSLAKYRAVKIRLVVFFLTHCLTRRAAAGKLLNVMPIIKGVVEIACSAEG